MLQLLFFLAILSQSDATGWLCHVLWSLKKMDFITWMAMNPLCRKPHVAGLIFLMYSRRPGWLISSVWCVKKHKCHYYCLCVNKVSSKSGKFWTLISPVFLCSLSTFHSLIRGVLIQSCSAGAKKFTNYVCILSSTIQWCYPKYWKLLCHNSKILIIINIDKQESK